MKNQKILVFCSFLCISVLSACFSPWGPETMKNLAYTVTLTNGDEFMEVKSTATPIVITVPEGKWEIDIEAEATGDGWSSFAERPPKFFGKAWVKNDKEEKVTIDTSAMNPSIQVKGWGQLSKAFNGDWDKFLKEIGWKPKNKPQEYFIELLENTSTDSTSAILDGDSDKNIILRTKENVTIQRGTNLKDPLFQIRKGTLTLGGTGEGKIIIKGNDNNQNQSLISVSGTLYMHENVLITGNTAYGSTSNDDANNGGGVRVEKGGKFIMEGGMISDNHSNPTGSGTNAGGGGGVYVYGDDTGGGEFIMNGGTISENTTKGHGGGVRVYKNSIFTMNGGTISENTVISKSNDSKDNGGGVRVRGTFIMNGGTIFKNHAPYGGGVSVADDSPDGKGIGSFIMKGGTISGNDATSGNGGGVHVDLNGTFSKTGGIISGSDGDSDHPPNIATRGQAVYAQSGNTNTNRSKNTNSGPVNILSSSPGGNFSTGWD